MLFLISSEDGSGENNGYSFIFGITLVTVIVYEESIHGDLSERAPAATNLGVLDKTATIREEAGISVDREGKIVLMASGAGIFNDSDAFQFAYLPLVGEGEITTQRKGLENTCVWTKAGVMTRETLDVDSLNVMT